MNELIVRQKYLAAIEPYIGQQIIKIFTGQRRVGKSYILLQTIEKIKAQDPLANILYINKEDLQFLNFFHPQIRTRIARHTPIAARG